MKRQTIKTIITLLFLIVSLDAYAQLGESNYDTRVKSLLDDLDIEYTISDAGSFFVLVNVGKYRNQAVSIPSVTDEFGGMEIRQILSLALQFDSKDALNQNNLFAFLKLNYTYKIGSWRIAGSKLYRLVFTVNISANATKSTLEKAIRHAAKTADEMEQKLTGEDKF